MPMMLDSFYDNIPPNIISDILAFSVNKFENCTSL